MELSIDPTHKSLLRIFCQSIDSQIEYKSMEYNDQTTAQQVKDKMIELLQLNEKIDDLILCETIGRCMALNRNGTMIRKLAKSGQAAVFIEQHKRALMGWESINTILNYWRPNSGYTRRLELFNRQRSNQMSSNEIATYPHTDIHSLSYPISVNKEESLSSNSKGDSLDVDHKFTQTEIDESALLSRPPQCPCLITLKGDSTSTLIIHLSDFTDFGTPGSGAKVCLRKLSKYVNQILCTFSKTKVAKKAVSKIVFNNHCTLNAFDITINGVQTPRQAVLCSGDIINIGDVYSFFFKDNTSISGNTSNSNKSSNIGYSDQSDPVITVNGVSSPRALNSSKEPFYDPIEMTLDSFDTTLRQLINYYLNNGVQLQHVVALTMCVIKFCQDSISSRFSIEVLQDHIMKSFCRSLEESIENDNYIQCNLKLSALGFQTWMVYYNDNCLKANEESRQWLNYFESFTFDTFSYLSNYICEETKHMSQCFFDENPLSNIDESQSDTETSNEFTMETLLDFLKSVYRKIERIGCVKTVSIFKRVLTSRMIVCLTESTVTVLLSNMRNFTWQKGVQISSQLDKIENWLKDEGQLATYMADGFLYDFSKLLSTRSAVLKEMEWKVLRVNYKNVHPSILRQFISGLVINEGSAPLHWQPPQDEMFESNKDVGAVLSAYLDSEDPCTLFQPGIVLLNDCIDINLVTQSSEFNSICSKLDSDRNDTANHFRWRYLSKLKGCTNLRNIQLPATKTLDIKSKPGSTPASPQLQKKVITNQMRPNSDRSDVTSQRVTPVSKQQHKSNLITHSKSLAGLNNLDSADKVDIKYSNNLSLLNSNADIKRSSSFNSDIDIIETHNNKPSLLNGNKKTSNVSSVNNSSVKNVPELKPYISKPFNHDNISTSVKKITNHSRDSTSDRTFNQSDVVLTKPLEKAPPRKYQADVDISSSPHNKEVQPQLPNRVSKYRPKTNLNMHSKSLATLNDLDAAEKNLPKYDNNDVTSTNFSKPTVHDNIRRSPSFNSDIDSVDARNNQQRHLNGSKKPMQITTRSSSNINNISGMKPSISRPFKKDKIVEDDSKRLSENCPDDLWDCYTPIQIKVELKKSLDESYGITIIDGMSSKLNKDGLFIHEIKKESPAYKCGKLVPGDKILEINNYETRHLNFLECLMMMKKSLTVLNLLIEKEISQKNV